MPMHSPSFRLQGLGVISVAIALIAWARAGHGNSAPPVPLKAATGAPLQAARRWPHSSALTRRRLPATPEAAGTEAR
jgi:hypothetical protein